MQEVNINNYINEDYILKYNDGYDNISFIGKIDKLIIDSKYNKLNLFKLECNTMIYKNQSNNSIINHILPHNLKILICCSNSLTNLPNDLPNNITELYCGNNKLKLLPNIILLNKLKILECSYNELTFLPNLPNSLEKLYCFNNKLTDLYNIPNSLIEFNCSYNQLTLLHNLPDSLKILYCYNNKLNSLMLPNFIEEIYCSNNEIDSLNYFMPKTIKTFYINNNKIQILPKLSNELRNLTCDGNNITEIMGLPKLTNLNYYSPIDIKGFGKIDSEERRDYYFTEPF